MKKIYVYGTGSKAFRLLPALSLKHHIIGFIDSNITLQGQDLLGIKIYHLSEFSSGVSNQIIIASSFIDEIKQTLAAEGITNSIAVEDLPEVMLLAKKLNEIESRYRQQSTAFIPQVPLKDKHLKNATLITNRQKLLELLPPNGIVAELGVANGDYTSQILKISQPKKLHLIDIWQSERYNEILFNNVRTKFAAELTIDKVEIHRKLSHEAAKDFSQQYFDWIYIDTSHCYNGTKKELEYYASKIRDGGFIAGHDYTMGNWNNQYRYGVMEAVHEFCVKYNWRFKYLTMDLSEGQSFAIERIPQ